MTIKTLKVDAIIIGGGFSGCAALHRLRGLGLITKIIEAGSEFGGVWHWNRYPGARVDGEWLMYQLSFHEVWKDWHWTERFPGGDELRSYFQHVGDTLNLRKDTFFKTVVTSCQYNRVSGLWTVYTEQGWHAECRYLVAASGASYKSYIPQYPGIDRYQGIKIHPSAYPEGLNVRGKRVGIIGTGASSVQLVQELAKQASTLTLFARTPAVAILMRQRKIAPFEAESGARRGLATWWLDPLLSTYSDYTVDKKANAIMYDYWAQQVRAQMKNQAKMDIVAPLKQDQWWAIKRPCLEQDYYKMIDQPSVTVHDLKRAPIRELDEQGVVTSDGRHHDFDILVFATGYDALTGSLLDLGLRGDHHSLSDIWKEGTLTYLGMMIPDMPNLFVLYGPQAPSSGTCGPQFIEMQIDWICQAITKMQGEGLTRLEPTWEASKSWREEVVAISNATLYSEADTWWSRANIPGKRREPLLYLGGVPLWWKKCSHALNSWEGFKTG